MVTEGTNLTDGSASFLRAARAGNLEKVLEFLKTNTDINTCNPNGLNALHLASKEGHVNVVRELLQRGANVDAATKKGNTALHIASLAGQEEIVKVLVLHQALVNIQSQNGFTPLYMAAQENHDSVVRFLLANNANQSLATEDGFTPLAVALQQGHDKVVAVLLENDTRGKVRLPALHIAAKKDDTKAAALLLHTDHNPDVTSKSGFTPLHIAAHYGNENIANLLIQRGADVNYIAKHQITPLHVASKWGKGNMVSLLIDKGANYEAKTRDGLTPLHCAARSGHETVVDMLLEKGAPITSKTKNGLAPLHMASQGDHVDAARILLYHKAPVDDVTVDFLTALHVAAHCGHVRVAKLLLDRKADPNSRALNGFTPLHIACKKNRIKVVELLLKHGASIEATTESGLTPLHVASFMGCMNIVIYLIQHGASADVPTVRGETPLHLAARANQTDIIRILLRNGAQVDARAREQQTALHIASRLGNSDIVVLLLQHGAAVDATTKDHYTALHIAAKEGQEEVASVLLEHGASLTSTTKKGFTPLHLAAKYGNLKVARLLLQKDAPVDAQGKNGVTPLHVAAHYDHQNVAMLLLDKGASPHATAKNGYTPLHIAARKNQMDIATTLLEYEAKANAESKAGFTPLHLSSQEGHTDMATLLIEHKAPPGACAKNGLTPLHLCAQEDRVNVAAILVKHRAQIDPETRAGYTPLHVACHFGQMNMVRLLLKHGAKVDSTTQLGYTPLHQAAQQGHTQIVNLLLENKAEPNTETNDGKTALSIAQRLGYISVVETLKIVTETTINTTTTTVTEEKYKVVVPETMHETFMSESEDEGGDDTMVSSMFGKQQHVTLPFYEGQLRYTSDDTMLGDQSYRYLTVDEMKSLGDDSLPIDVTKDEKMDVSFISNSMAAPPVAPADQLSPQHQKEHHYPQFTGHYPSDNVDVAKTPILAGPESLNTTLNTTVDSAMIESQIEPQIIQTKLAPQLSAQMNQEQVQLTPVQQIPVQNNSDQVTSGQFASVTEKSAEILNGWEGFLVSFMVDARGGAMRGCRHSGVRVIIPPRKAAMPMRVTCRYLKKDKLVHAPPLMEGEALASRILEMGPAGAKFLGPVIIEVPHFASLRGKEREIVILRSDNGETWREHTLEATEEAVQEVLNESFDGEELKQLEDLNTNRITRILTTDFPQYFAIVTRIRQEVHAIGPEGGMVSSTVVPQVQAVFPQGALTKKIKVGLQAQPIPTDLVAKLLGNRVAVSPIVTVEPRRRKFHKPITLTIPVPQASSKGMINQYSGEAPTLRLLCSITGVFRKRSLKGGTTRAQWEDVTGSTPLTFVNDCVSFTTTVSARFWLMDCSNIPEATKMATELYREAIHVPFMAKFVVFSKRHQLEEARVRVFCMTDDREDKTLEHQELFVEVAKSRDVEVLEGKPQFLEFAGNLVPVTKSGDQLAFNFYAFRENRLPFTVRVKDQHADPIGRVAFMRQPKDGRWKKGSLISLLKPPVFQVGRGDPPQTPICNLNIALPDNIQPEPAPSEPDLLALEKKYSFLSISKADTIHKADLRLTDISNMLGTDWVALAHELEINDSDINIIKSQYPDNAPQQAIVMLRLWMQTSGNKANGNTLEKGLRKISRDDIVNQCIFNVELVTDDIERAMAKAHLDQSGFEAFKDELGPSRDATLNRDVSLDVSYDEQDMMKRLKDLREAESAEEEEENQRAYQDKSSREQRTVDMSPTYESEEKKYAGEEKIVTEEKVTREDVKDGSTITISTTSTTVIKQPSEDIKLEKEVEEPVLEPKVEAIIKEQIIPEPIKETKVEPSLAESVVSEPIQETIITTEEVISHVEPQKKMVFTVTEAEEEEIEKDEQVVEQKELEKPVVKVVEKPAEVIEKIEEVKMEPETFEEIHAPEVEETQKTQKTTTVTEIISGPAEAPTTVTTTQKETYTTSDDGTIQEHIVVQKQTTKAVDGLEMGEDKSVILQKLGEELGRLDEKLEEKFREKRKTDEPEVAQEEVKEEVVAAIRREGQAQPTSQIVVEYGTLPSTLSVTTTTTTTTTSSITPTPDGFTQTSVESSQMSSKRGTAEVSYPGTTTTIDDDAVMQMGQALIQQTAPQLVDKRIVQEDPLQEEVSQQYQTVQEQPLDKTAAEPDASAKSGRTEERGCSPITVLEARPEVDQVTVRPLSRGSSHTITTTTSWGAPVSTTTNIQLGDNESAHCVQFTLHSESRVTLHAPGEIWDELRHVKQGQEEQQRQQQPEQQDSTQKESRGEVDNKDDITTLASITTTPKEQTDKDISQEDTSQKHLKSRDDDEKVEELQAPVSDASGGRDITSSVTDSQAAAAYHDIVGVVTSAESISEFRHKTPDPSKTVSDDVIESTRDTLHDQFTSSNQIDSVKERLTSSEFRVQTVEEVSERVSQSPETAEVVEATAKENVSKEDTLSSEETIDKAIISVLPETVVEEIAQSLVGDITSTECEHPAAISEDPLYVASEITAPSAHRPTTLMITSNSNESTDDAECTTNDPSKIGRENDIPRDLSQEGSSMVAVEESKQQGMGTEQCSVMSERLSGSEGGAVPRTERPVRPAPRTTTLVKVKVEKRPVGSHPQVRERIAHEHQTVVRAPSVEEEVRGLMQEVKEATSQIKQEVKELRQADTPTPDTPTPLREFKEFLNREEEQEQERLPTIKEMCRESEEDASVNTGAPSIFGKRQGIESFFYKGFFLPPGTHEAGQLAEQQTPPLSHEQASSGQPPSGTKAGSDGGLHGGCPEAQGMDWEGKSVDSMYTETVVQAKLSMLPEVDTSEGVAPTSFSSSTLPPAAPPLSTASLCTDLPHPSNIQPQAQTFQDLTQQPSQTYLNLEPSHLHDSHSFELQGFDTSPSSATKLSDHLFLEKGYVNGAEATTSQLVASPSFASLQSESVAPITGTDEIAAASVTFNTSSAFMSLGPISPTENSSEDHAEIDRTSTEISPDSVRFEQDILDTRTEDEAPDLDDDLFPASPVLGPELSERIFSVEATEDTDITTPMEMRDSHTERDASASNLEFGDDKDGTDGKSDLKESLHFETKDDSIAYLAEEIKEIQNKVNRLQEQVKSQIDPIAARSEVEMILNTMEDIREAVGDSKIENNPEFNNMAQDILSSISSISETVAEMMQTLRLSDPEYADFRSRDEKITAKRTDSTVVETGSAYDGSPSDTNLRDQSFSDLLDSEELNRDSLEDDFDRLAADLSLSPKTDLVVEISPKVTSTAAPSDVLSSPVSSNVYPSKPPDALQATQREPDVGVVFTEHKEYGGRVKPSAETTGGHSHISPSPSPHPSQSIQSSSSTSSQQKVPSTAPMTLEKGQRSLDESPAPSRPTRRHERTFSQASNIFTGAIPTEPKPEPRKEEKPPISEESAGITENIKPYSERKQFWESVTAHSSESKTSQLIKSEAESDTDTTGTDGTIVEQKIIQTKKVSATESSDSEAEYIRQRDDPAFYENAGFAGTEKIDVPKEVGKERAISPFEVLRPEDSVEDLPSPEDIALKDVSSKRALFEKEIKRQSMEFEESQSWKRSSKEYDETVVITEESASSVLKKREESEHQVKETMEKDKETIKEKLETKKDDMSQTDRKKTETKSKTDKTSSREDHSEIVESSKLHHEKMETKEKTVMSEVSASGKKSITQTDASTEKKEKESTEKAEKVIHERKDSQSGTFSKTISKSEEKTESSSEAKEIVQTISTEDQDISRDEITEEDMTRTEETSEEEEPDDIITRDKTTINITEESRQVGDTHETVVRETTTTRDGGQEQRVIKETKTQETAMSDGSTVKTTSITTFTTQLDSKEHDDLGDLSKTKTKIFAEQVAEEPTESLPEEKHIYSTKTAKEKSEAFFEQRMKSDIFSQELSSSAEDQSPERKVLTPKDTKAPVSLQAQVVAQPLTSPILVPKETVEDIVWEVSQERSETIMSETVQDIPLQQPVESHHVKDISVDGHKKMEKTPAKPSTASTKAKLSEEEARKLAIEIVEEVKAEAVKRSPLVTPSQTVKDFSAALQDEGAQAPLPKPVPESAFTEETTTKIGKYIQEQLGDDLDEKQLKLIESVTARKTEILQKKMVGREYQQSMEITDEDLRSSGAELSPIEHQMERLRQMTEEEDIQRFPREPSEADESESSIIIHETVDDIISSEYDQANQMISKTLDALKTADINKTERSIETIREVPETVVSTAKVEVKRDIDFSDTKELIKLSQSEVKETARQLVKEVTEKAKESEAVKQASLATELRQATGIQEQSRTPSPKSGSKPGSRKGSWMDDEELRREFRRDYEDKKKMFKEEMTSDQQDVFDVDTKDSEPQVAKMMHQKSSESHKEVHMESSMTESMEESSTVESVRSFVEAKMRPEAATSVIRESREVEREKTEEERSVTVHEVVVMRKKSHVEEFNRRSGTDFDAYSSSGESHYFTAAEGTSDSRAGSRPCSSDVEALMSERTGTSEYDTALTSQDTSQYSSYSNSSRDYRTAASSMSSRDSMKSIDSESSGNLASVELSEASETLVPSAVELEKDMDLLEQELMEEDLSHTAQQSHHTIIPQLTIQSETPKSEDMPCPFDLESDDGEFDQEAKDEERETHVTSRMKRSIEMTFHPEPKSLTDDKKPTVVESIASSLEESTLSEVSMATVIEQDKSMQGSTTTDSIMTTSSVSEHMVSSIEGQESERQISRTDSGVLTTETGDGDMALHSVTITATAVPSSTPDQSTASMCTQVTSETRSQVDLTESEQFFHANGPTEVDYVPEYDDEEVRGARPGIAPTMPPAQEVAGAVAGPSEGPQKVTIVEECYETEADQEYGQMMRESEYSEMAEAELQYSLEEQPEAEMSSMLVIDEPLERPRTPEPGYVPSSRPTQMIIQSPDEPEEFTEVDKRFSAVFSTTYEEREEGARSLIPGMSVDVPDITVTEHTLPMPSQYCYPDLEREEDFPECRALAEASAQEVPATPGSQESASTGPSRKSSSTDSEQGREYCLDDVARGLPFESFEMIEAGDIDDFSEYERTLCMHEERMLEMSQIREEEEEEVEEDQRINTSPIAIPSQLKAVKVETKRQGSIDSQTHDPEEVSTVGADPTIEEQRRWLELQFEESDAANFDYPQGGFLEHVYSGPLEDIEEEREDAERRDLSHITKTSSLSSTPEYDVLAGRKFFTRSGEHDDISMSSLQEFENLEREVAVEAVARRSSSGSQESLNGKKPESKSGQGDDISVGSFASLQEFERLEKECIVVEQIEKKAQEEEAMLSEIEEGHESQVSESESCETLSEAGRGSVEGEEFDQRMFEIDEIIRLAQSNVEKFDKNKPGYAGVQLQDIVSVDGSGDDGTGSSQADRTPSVGREDGDADSLEEAQLPELDMDNPDAAIALSAKLDVMTASTDSIEALAKKNKVPRETSQDSLEKVQTRSSDPMATSVDSIDLTSRQDPMTASTDSLEGRRKRQDPMSASTDSIDPCRRDLMTTSVDSLGRDDSSGRDADISSGSEQVRPLPKDGLMECSTDSLEPSSSQATHAFYQYDTDSIMSGSFTSGCSNTLLASTDEFPDVMTSSMYLPEGELPREGEEHYVKYMHASSGSAAEMVAGTSEPGFSHSITRVVRLPPEAHHVTFTGPDAQSKLEDYIQDFNAGQHSSQDEVVDDQGNVHIRRVTQTRVVADPSRTEEHGFSLSEPSTEETETETRDEHGNVTRVIRRTVVTSQTIEVDLDTGEPIVQPGPVSSSSSSSSSPFSRIPRPVTSPPLASRPPPPGPPPGSRGPREPVPPSLEPNTVSGLDVEEMSSVMESYTSDGSDPIIATHITRYDPDPLTTTTTTHTTRIIRRTQVEDGEVKEDVYEEY
ncbi:ankyrin-2-like isoform X6 [Homarus americanus]|uniref:ankyrin-2-like isoform X6 n=1 Tax=Homarus americanus TaxID=6706 RepID=UPI001C47C40E|nr:ankyrin-2-like isoform X6 [Homarus americanus]